jgi:hypothetical protein
MADVDGQTARLAQKQTTIGLLADLIAGRDVADRPHPSTLSRVDRRCVRAHANPA